MPPSAELPYVIADGPLAEAVTELLQDRVHLLPWEVLVQDRLEQVRGLYTYGHPTVDAAVLDRLPNLEVISNYGVGVDHIDLHEASRRGVPVGNTPGVLDGATADLAFTLLLAAARRLVEGDRYARSPGFTRYDPGYMLGQEVHGRTLGIFGMGRIGRQIARRGLGFDMKVLYHNRRRLPAGLELPTARYVSCEQLLRESDFLVLSVPLSAETEHLIGSRELAQMKSTAILVNVSRGRVVDTQALTEALQQRRIYAAAVDVTDPEPLPRDHPLLRQDNLVITPHLGSATVQTRQRMAEISVENLLLGLAGQPLRHDITQSQRA